MVAPFFIASLMLAGVALCALANGIAERRGYHVTALGQFVLSGVAGALAVGLLAAAVWAL